MTYKELRETHIILRIIKRSEMITDIIIDKANELAAIFTSTINTSSKTIKR